MFSTSFDGQKTICQQVAIGLHTGGMNVGLADGSVRFLGQGISGTTWWAALTPSGGEPMPSDWNN